jgi:hypothetical protein
MRWPEPDRLTNWSIQLIDDFFISELGYKMMTGGKQDEKKRCINATP